MTFQTVLKAPLALLVIWIALFGAIAAQAQTFQQVVESLQVRAAQEFTAAQNAADHQNFPVACDGFMKSAELYTDALERIASRGTWGQTDPAKIESYSNGIAANADSAIAAAKTVCNRGDESTYQYQPEDMQRIVAKSMQQAGDAERQYRANDRSGACESARMAADGFHEVTTAMKADPSLEAAFGNVDQVYENARMAALDRDRTYCAK